MAAAPSAEQTLPLGDAANTAARFEQAAGPSEILFGEPTYRLVRAAVRVEPVQPLELKGKAEPVPAWRLLEVIPDAPGLARRMDASMVGREAELALLLQAFRVTVTESRCNLITVIGEAGVGKSRLVRELQKGLAGRGKVLLGRCLPYGEAGTFWPIAEVLRQAAGIVDADPKDVARAKISAMASSDPDAERIGALVAGAIGLTTAGASPEETSWASAGC